MSSFTKPLTVTKLKNGKWKVERQFTYFIGSEGSNVKIHVPKGFKTDFASVPRLFWSIIPPDGKYSQAAVLHDYLYSRLGLLPKRKYKRSQCDKIFLEAMKVLKVSFWRRRVMYRAVRLGGGIGWRIHQKRSVKNEKKS